MWECIFKTSNANTSEVESPTIHTLSRPNGSTFVFFKQGHEWKTISKTPLKLKETETGFKLINLNDGVEEYNHEGRLLSITNMGQTTTLNYSPRGELISIIDPFGEKIELYLKTNGNGLNFVFVEGKDI